MTLADLKVDGAADGECRQPLEAESGSLLTACKEMPPLPSYNHEELKLTDTLNALANGSLLGTWREESSLASMLM